MELSLTLMFKKNWFLANWQSGVIRGNIGPCSPYMLAVVKTTRPRWKPFPHLSTKCWWGAKQHRTNKAIQSCTDEVEEVPTCSPNRPQQTVGFIGIMYSFRQLKESNRINRSHRTSGESRPSLPGYLTTRMTPCLTGCGAVRHLPDQSPKDLRRTCTGTAGARRTRWSRRSKPGALHLRSLLLVAMPGAPSSVLAPSSDALCS